MKYKINGKEIKLLDWKLGTYYTEKINELIQALGEPVEEKKKWDKNNLKDGDEFWYVDSYGDIDLAYYYSASELCNWRVQSGNCFPDEKSASEYKEKLIKDNL